MGNSQPVPLLPPTSVANAAPSAAYQDLLKLVANSATFYSTSGSLAKLFSQDCKDYLYAICQFLPPSFIYRTLAVTNKQMHTHLTTFKDMSSTLVVHAVPYFDNEQQCHSAPSHTRFNDTLSRIKLYFKNPRTIKFAHCSYETIHEILHEFSANLETIDVSTTNSFYSLQKETVRHEDRYTKMGYQEYKVDSAFSINWNAAAFAKLKRVLVYSTKYINVAPNAQAAAFYPNGTPLQLLVTGLGGINNFVSTGPSSEAAKVELFGATNLPDEFPSETTVLSCRSLELDQAAMETLPKVFLTSKLENLVKLELSPNMYSRKPMVIDFAALVTATFGAKLKFATFEGCEFVNTLKNASVWSLPKLHTLKFTKCNFEKIVVSNSQLEQALKQQETKGVAVFPFPITDLLNLRVLKFSNCTSISQQIVDYLSLQSLALSNLEITSTNSSGNIDNPDHVEPMPIYTKLTKLTNFTTTLVSKFSHSISKIEFRNAKLTEFPIETLVMFQLEYLNLENNQIQSLPVVDIAQPGSFVNLKYFNIAFNQLVTSEIVTATPFASKKSVIQVDCSHNPCCVAFRTASTQQQQLQHCAFSNGNTTVSTLANLLREKYTLNTVAKICFDFIIPLNTENNNSSMLLSCGAWLVADANSSSVAHVDILYHYVVCTFKITPLATELVYIQCLYPIKYKTKAVKAQHFPRENQVNWVKFKHITMSAAHELDEANEERNTYGMEMVRMIPQQKSDEKSLRANVSDFMEQNYYFSQSKPAYTPRYFGRNEYGGY